MQLIMFPYAGGNRTSFNDLIHKLKCDSLVIEYPGRGRRVNDSYPKTWDELLEDVKNQINVNEEFSFFGYSMGTIIAYDLMCCGYKPKHAFFCAMTPNGDSLPLCTHEDFIIKMINMGGLSEIFTRDMRIAKFITKPAYEDYKLIHSRNANIFPKIDIDITTFFCDSDTPFYLVKRWSEYTNGYVEYYNIGLNHFFIQDCYDRMSEIINLKLREV